MPNIAVFIEQRDGEAKKVAWQMINHARKITDASGGEVWGVFLGKDAGDNAATAGSWGAHKLFTAIDENLAGYNSELYTTAVASFCSANNPDLVLMGATAMGKDLAPRLAARMDCACVSDSIDVEFNDGFTVRRPVFAGKCYTDVNIKSSTAVVGIRPNSFNLGEPGSDSATAETFDAGIGGVTPKATVAEVKATSGGAIELTEADVIVSGGRGIKESDNYKLIEELAAVLNAGTGASRAIVDAGWIDHSHQVGQTGKTVSPNLYIACGISGAIQHLAGMSSSKCIVAINKDSNAPIFKAATYGIVADLFDVVPALKDAIQALD
jgi:electron transfer flavoprotein alpha subunit